MGEIAFINKWIHLLSIIGVMGGIVFAWLVLVPAAKSAPEAAEALKGMWKRFGIWLAVLWLVVLATGFYNLMLVSPTVTGHYQMLLGMKMGLAILMFLISLLIAHPIPMLARFFEDKSAWLIALMLLGTIIVGLSADLNLSRINGSGLKPVVHSSGP